MSTVTKSKAERFVIPINPSHLPKGFVVSSTYAGIKAAISPKPTPDASAAPSSGPTSTTSPKPDLAVIVSSKPAAAAGTFTRNAFKAAPVVLSSKMLLDGSRSPSGARARSILVNSGCANAVTGERGMNDAKECAKLVGELLTPAKGISQEPQDPSKQGTLLLSTGVIGVPLPMTAIKRCLSHLTSGNVLRSDADAWHETARAFMTTDTFPKLRARSFELAGRKCGIVGIDKGAGMIHPSMAGPSTTLHATLLGLLATDAPISPPALQKALEHAMSRSFNCISVDGDMSTNDTIIALANGAAPPSPSPSGPVLKAGEEITEEQHPEEFEKFKAILTDFCEEMAHLIVRDGEGAEKFVEIKVKGAPTYEHAHAIASSISTSALVKCALHGGDANWGRILCAVGYAPLPSSSSWSIDPSRVTVTFVPPAEVAKEHRELVVLKDGAPQKVDEVEAGKLLAYEDINIVVDLAGGSDGDAGAKEEAKYWTCDLSREYIAINGDYRS
ncbi:arginine biosynthesis protein ArgJ [Violaceomyces palustris]|uniref:Arginine biosynthesis protein ArgJ n=1 Tax=Violaceomyces palustris TaxID=1673888 RepID=A0ACD0P3B4_9BASI|nr:arginine biosynthesis protein ArgJ [Violaceomyces palustris]